MKITFYGTRGSLPVCASGFQEFGGDTTCILVEGPRRTGILDAGTGIRQLGKDLYGDVRLGIDQPCVMMFSHFHWDHIQGLPFFGLAYDPRRTLAIYALGREHYGKDIKSIFEGQMQKEYFPVPLDGMGAKIEFIQTLDRGLSEGDASIVTLKHNHPGGAYSYRITDVDGKVLVFCTDIEHGDTIDEAVVEFARDADLLIHEGQYTPEELTTHRRWGHSSWEQAVQVAQAANVKQLVITHHDPDHDDVFLRDVEKQVQAMLPSASLARQGMKVVI